MTPNYYFEAVRSLRPDCFLHVRGEKEVKTYTDDQPFPSDSEIEAEITRLKNLEPWNELREKRNQLLAETDYLALSDVTMSDEMKTYRQALRDLPANTSDPANPTWPTKPGG